MILMTTKIIILAIVFAIVLFSGSTPLGFSESLKVQLENEIETNQIQCNNSEHVLVQRSNGNFACVTERTSEKTGWEIITNITDNIIDNSTKLEMQTILQKEINILKPQKEEIEIKSLINEKSTLKENIESKLILNPKNISELIPTHTVFDYQFDVTKINQTEFAKGMANLTGDKILEIEDKENETKYITQKGWMTFYKASNILMTDKFNYKLIKENVLLSSQIDTFPQKLISFLDIELDGTEVIKDQIDPTSSTWFILQNKGEIGVNSVSIDFSNIVTTISFGYWNNNLDEMELIDPYTAKQKAIEYILKFKELGDECDFKLYEEMYDEIYNEIPIKRFVYLQVLDGVVIYNVDVGFCQSVDPRIMVSPYEVYLDAVTGEALFAKGSQHLFNNNENIRYNKN